MGTLSIVLPAYNEELMIEETWRQLSKIMEDNNIPYELVMVDDGSKDGTWEKICSLPKDHVTGVSFSRNFGKEAAVFAGLETASGDCVAVMDCDLQHPPETLVTMYSLWKEGYEVVEGIKSSRGKESRIHKGFANLFYSLMSKAMHLDMANASDFKLMDRKVVDTILLMKERNPFFRAMSSWVGFRKTTVEYEVQERMAGDSKWSFKSLVKYAISNISSYSAAPMQLVTIAGILTFLLAVILGIQTLIRYFTGTATEGFTTVILLVLVIGSILMMSLGIIGYYVARIYEEIKGRPRFIISRTNK